MKRVYLVTILVLFLLFVVIGFNWQGANVAGSATVSNDAISHEFSSFGLIAIVVFAILGSYLIKQAKKKS